MAYRFLSDTFSIRSEKKTPDGNIRNLIDIKARIWFFVGRVRKRVSGNVPLNTYCIECLWSIVAFTSDSKLVNELV